MPIAMPQHDRLAQQHDGPPRFFIEEPSDGGIVIDDQIVGGVTLGAVQLHLQRAMEGSGGKLSDRVVASANGGNDEGHEVKNKRFDILGDWGQVLSMHPKDTLDACWITNGNLNVVLRPERRTGVEGWVLDEDAFDRIKGTVSSIAQPVNVIHDSAVEVMTAVGPIFRKRLPRLLRHFLHIEEGVLHLTQPSAGCKVKTES